MSPDSAPLLAAVAIVVVMLFSLAAAAERSRRHAAREGQLRRAAAQLDELTLALDALDDEATPAVMLEYALRLSDAFTSPSFAGYVRDQLAQNPLAASVPIDDAKTADESELADALQATIRTRPDLVVAFVRTFSAALSAFEARWPECAPYFDPVRSHLLTRPAVEARRVVNVSNRQAAHVGFGAPDMAAAA